MKRGPKPNADRSAVRSNDAISPLTFRLTKAERVRLDRVLAAHRRAGKKIKTSELLRLLIAEEAERLGVPE